MLGRENIERLFTKNVAVFGIGGVGGACAEALARTGVGGLDLFDNDRVCVTNINRQIIATTKTVGLYKADVMRERILDIHPDARVNAFKIFYLPESAESIDLTRYDYIVDAVDTITAKIELICRANALGIPVISSMGAANKLDPTAFMTADIYETSVCPLAKVMRHELRKRGVKALRVVYSKEPPVPYAEGEQDCLTESGGAPSGASAHPKRRMPASNAFVPPVAGLIMAGEVIKGLLGGYPTTCNN